MELKGFFDLPAYGLQGVEGGHRVLHHHGDFLAAYGLPLFFGLVFRQVDGMFRIHAVIPDLAGVHPAVLVQKADEILGEDGFAGAGFADDGQGFALVQVQGDAPDRVEHFAAEAELYMQILYGKDDISVV